MGCASGRSGDMDSARNVFEKMLCPNPWDNQGARFLMTQIDTGASRYAMNSQEGSALVP